MKQKQRKAADLKTEYSDDQDNNYRVFKEELWTINTFKMKYLDVQGCIYSARGLRFGGFQTDEFLNVTEKIVRRDPDVRERIVWEANYLAFWLDHFSEIALFLTVMWTGSILWGILAFLVAYLFELGRFYTIGPMLILSQFSFIWSYLKFPAFLFGTYYFWSSNKVSAIFLFLFAILQCLTHLGRMFLTLFVHAPISKFLYAITGKETLIKIREGLVLQWVIMRWTGQLKYKPDES